MDQYGDRQIRGTSTNWKNWMCEFIPTTCVDCKKKHGKIYPMDEDVKLMHEHCYCSLVPMRVKAAGTATEKKDTGVDRFLKDTGKLPGEYITKKDAREQGWKRKKGNLADVMPGKIIGGDVYYNKDGKLPQSEGRVWYEADFDYYSGYRNDAAYFIHRMDLYSHLTIISKLFMKLYKFRRVSWNSITRNTQ